MANEKILVTQSSMPPYEEYIEAIKPLWESHWLTNMGTYHKELEEELNQYLGVPELSLMVNGHMALEMAIQAFDFPEDSEVITTPFTFVSTTHAIVRNRLKPVFCDVKMSDGTIDETKIEDLITEKTVAIVPVHVYGNVCNVEAIQEIADKYNLKVFNSHPRFPFCKRVSHFESDLQILYPTFHFCNDFPVFSLAFMI